MSKLIVIDGLDSSGKQTQAELLESNLKNNGYNVLKIHFPNYEDQASALVRMYLNGEFGADPSSVNAYAASSFYAVERYASYKRYWQDFYKSGGVVVSDRYTTSNAIHQAVKLKKDKREAFFKWLYDFEFNLLGLPLPDLVIFLDVLPQISFKLMEKRLNKINGGMDKDIHEKNKKYMIACYECAVMAAKTLGWVKIDCVKNGDIRPAQEIQTEVFNIVISKIK